MLQEPMEVNASLEAVSALKMPGYVGLLSGQLVERDEMWHDATYEDLMGWMGCFKIVLYMYIYIGFTVGLLLWKNMACHVGGNAGKQVGHSVCSLGIEVLEYDNLVLEQ